MNDGDRGALKPGDILNHTYRIEALVGVGGTGEVYRATNLAQNSEVAVKVLRREFASDERFVLLMQREAAVLDSIVDPAVVRYYGLQKTGDFGGLVFLVTEFIRGPSLADMMEKGPVPADDLVHVAKRAAEGLRAAHGRGAYHRDLSPDNILLRDGDPQRAVLIDFGIAKDVDSGGKTVAQGGFLGKYEYAPIDQIHGQVDARSDIYSLGMTLLAAFHGRHPRFDGYDAMLDAKSKVPPLDKVPEPLRGLVEKMVQPRPQNRFQSAEELIAAIGAPAAAMAAPAPASGDGALFGKGPESQPGMPRTETKAKKPAAPEKKGGGGAIAAVLGIAVIGGLGVWLGLLGGLETLTGPSLPVAAPYRLAAEDPGPGAGTASADAPDEATAAMLREALSAAVDGGEAQVRLASGVPSQDWATGAAALAKAAGDLDSFKLQIADRRALLTGAAADEAGKERIGRAAAEAARTAGLTLDLRLSAPEKRLQLSALRDAVEGVADCGALQFSGGDARGLGPKDSVTASGAVSSAQRVEAVRTALSSKLDGRALNLDLKVLTMPICAFERVLPASDDGSLKIELAYGADPRFPDQRVGPADSGEFVEGENPVIDILVPEGIKGYLHVYQVGTEGKVYHTFPPRQAPENRVDRVQPVAVDGMRRIRVQYSVAEIWDEPDDTPKKVAIVTEPYGLGLVIAVVTEEDLISTVAPNVESVASVVEDVAAALASSAGGAKHTARRIVTTMPKR